MEIFTTLFVKILPLYFVILLGYLAGKKLKVRKESIAPLLIYIIAPIVVFNGVIRAKLSLDTLSLPVVFFLLACFMCFIFYKLGGIFWSGSEKNILAFTSGTGNTGYFGLPVATAIFGQDIMPLAVLSILGFVLYENTIGFYITARGNFTIRDSIKKVSRLPTVYAFLLGVIVNLFHVNLGQVYSDIVASFQGTYSILGMMLIGLGIASIDHFKLDLKFISLAFLAKFIAWPVLVMLVIAIDSSIVNLYSPTTHKLMILMSTVPLAANTVAYAVELKVHPEKSATAVLLSTLVALFFIPALVAVLSLK